MSRVWVVGSINADLVLRVEHLPAPGETVHGDLDRGLGGKGANQAVAAARIGADVAWVGAVGDDEAASDLLAQLARYDVDVTHARHVAGPTGMAVVTVDSAGENAIVVVEGANGLLRPEDVATVPVGAGDVVVVQGELTLGTTLAALAAGRAASATTVWNPAPATTDQRAHLGEADVVVVNEVELATLSATSSIPDGVRELGRLGAGPVVATLGADGVVVWDGTELTELPARRVEVVDTTGAGDCFVGVLAAALAGGVELVEALATATLAASIAVGRAGAAASMPSGAEVACLRLAPESASRQEPE